jgi:hypothetical protein
VVEEIDTVILAADANKNVLIFHSSKNFGGTRTCPKNKLIGSIGLGAQATWVQIDLCTALANCNIIVPEVDEIAGCTTAQEVNNIPIPDSRQKPSGNFKGLASFAPAPAHGNAILATNTQDPFKLIPMLTRLAIKFDEAVDDNKERNGTATTHADDLNAWLYGIKRGLIPEARYIVIPKDNKAAIFFNNRHAQCITNARRGGLVQGGAVANNDAILQQLTTAIAAQGKATTETNDLCRMETQHQQIKEENKKDCTKKLHPSILKMVSRAAATHSTDNNEALPATFTCFINCDNVGMVQHDLIHQFKDLGYMDVSFTLGMTQALYMGEFLYADASTPSNFTIFAFHEQEPNSNKHQNNYLICHLLQVEGQKKLLDEIKALWKQIVNVPDDYNGLGMQIQLFTATSNIFFGKESIYTTNLRQLLLQIIRNKKNFCNQIALDEFFVQKFLLTVNRRVQHWMKMCEHAYHTRTKVKDSVLQFDDLIDKVLNGTFHLILPSTFMKVQGTISVAESKSNEPKKEGGKGSDKKQKNKNSNGNIVKNPGQLEEFKPKEGESWKDTFSKMLPQDRLAWTNKVKMCMHLHIRVDCYNNCSRVISHVTKDNIPGNKKELFFTLMKKCREECKKKA